MTTSSPIPSSPRRRAVLLRLLVGSLTVLVLLGTSRFRAAAAPISISQHAYVQVCKDTGGTPTRVTTYVVKCTYPNGATSTCNFVTKQCTDTPPTSITPGDNPNASPISGGDVPIGGVFVPGGDSVVFDGPTGTDVAASPDPTQPDGAAAPPQPHPGHAHHRHGHRRRT